MLDVPYAQHLFIAGFVIVPFIIVFIAPTRKAAILWSAVVAFVGVAVVTAPLFLDAFSMPLASRNERLLKLSASVLGGTAIGAILAYRFFGIRLWYYRARSR